MGLKVWFQDDVRSMLAGLTATVLAGDRELSEFDAGRLAMLTSVAVAFGLADEMRLHSLAWGRRYNKTSGPGGCAPDPF